MASNVKLTGTPSIQRIRILDELVGFDLFRIYIFDLQESSSITGTLLDNNVFSYYKYLAETGDMQAIVSCGVINREFLSNFSLDWHNFI